MALEEGIRHKSGPLKQQNKTHKHGRHRSKSEVDKTNKGRVGIKVISKKVRQAVGKTNRRHQAKQIRDKRREEVLEQKRKTGKQGSPPHLIAIVPLSSNCDVDQALKLLTECDSDGSLCSTRNTTTLVSQQLKQRFSFLPLKYGDLFAVLDAAKVSDSLLFLLNATHPLDSFGDKCLSCIFAQGLPTSFLGVQGLEEVPSKKRNDVKKHIQKIVEKRFPRDKIHNLESSQDALVALRLISNQHQRVIHFRDIRPHLLAESTTFEPNSEVIDVPRGTLKVCGFVRGKNLSVNRLVHLPGYGDFQMSQIDAPADPFPWQKRKKSSGFRGESMAVDTEEGTTSMDEDIKLIARADIAFQESLQSEVEPDPMEGEQTWPTDEELREAEAEARQEKKVVKRVPKGTSDYQAAWITNSDDEEGPDDDDNDEDDDEFEEEMEGSDGDDSMRNEDEEYETVSVAATETEDSKYDEDIDVDEERGQLEKMRAERENEMFPDEMDTPMDQPARVRFQRYRGLKSFRTSPWDPKENLPSDYARIFQFENFKRTKKRVLEEDEVDGAQPGWYVTVHISNVPRAFMDSLDPSSPLVIFGLLPHEQKMSVVHFVLKRHPTFSEPVRSKERLIFHCGFRRFTACPVFSQHTSGDKHKLERFMPQEGAFVATLYAPIMFPPAPVLVFTQDNHTSCHTLVGTGSLYKVDPDRIVAKKIVLSGHPFKINKRSVVLRYMFFNREDIHWFKPVELFTKYGRRGHIREPLGTHGHMKCVFDGMIKAQDTVCMNLYKRIFPKWTYEPAILPPPVETPKDIEDAMET
ncbi:pre-rRNA-processing protein TSR1 homolog isoform X1 [Pocillopora damicornis]|uniref:pre-rRNA-processing protein TSR1 homolog isoform X1 n=1 Tax=Pocillopora damicornis TaxID=46731 RepID=UPI000F54F162|nr:pre-rRNA-processing protein TSR1 homolog isoform X1 [Pocillopora damicornis]